MEKYSTATTGQKMVYSGGDDDDDDDGGGDGGGGDNLNLWLDCR